MRQSLNRLDALERAADIEVFANAFPFAIAYYLGGARHASEVVDAYARALGYKNLERILPSVGGFVREPSDSLANRRTFEGALAEAHCKLFAKHGYDLRRHAPGSFG